MDNTTTVVSKTGIKRNFAKIGVEDTSMNDNESLVVEMR
jgi:hypothetical protein